jgi:hypothetical protein
MTPRPTRQQRECFFILSACSLVNDVLAAITLKPEGSTFRIAGELNLLGGHSDGAGGQNRTGYARLFRAALYQ